MKSFSLKTWITVWGLFQITPPNQGLNTWDRSNQNVADLWNDPPIPTSGYDKVIFRNNLITVIPYNYFKNLPDVVNIQFGMNPSLSVVEDDAFFLMPQLTSLSIRNSGLQVITSKTFSGRKDLGHFP